MKLTLNIERRRKPHTQTEVEALACSMWLYLRQGGEASLTTEQRELLYDLLDSSPSALEDPYAKPLPRWWRDAR